MHTIYQLWVKKPLKTLKKVELHQKVIQILSTIPLGFNLLFCVATAIILTGNLSVNGGFPCETVAANTTLLAIARLTLYFFLVARYVIVINTFITIPCTRLNCVSVD